MVVPEGWEIVELGDKADIYRGSSPRPIDSFLTTKASGINWIKIGDASPYSKYIISSKERIIPEGLLYSRAVFKGDFILSNSMSFGRPYILKINGCIHDSWLAIQNYHRHFDTDFLYYSLCSETVLQQYINMAAGSSVKNLNKEKVAKLIICAPPLPEQRHIAEVLSDTDSYISALERLIAKKEAVKQGTMQELLTGKCRLPGFKGEWVEKQLGNVTNIFKGHGLSKAKIALEGCFPCILYGELFTEYNEIITSITSRTNYIEGVPSVKGDILIPASTTTIGIDLAKASVIPFDNVLLGGDINIIRPNDKNINSIFLAMYIMYTKKIEISIRAKGSTVYHLHGKDLFDLSLCIPPTLAEQTAIAEILSDMDAELSALKKKLEKIRLIKQGMMDALLTGKIRLPEDKPNVQFTQRKEQEEILYAAEKTEEYTANHKKRNKHIDDAVMIAGIVNELYSQKYPLGRKKVQKCLYLLRRHQKRSTTEFKKKAAGPYADEIRYRGGEPIALSAQYIITQKGTKGTLFFKGTNIQQALNYIEQWNMQTDIQWLRERLKFKSVDTLELWATVDMAICDLENMQMPISLSSIKHLIATNEEWKKKLEKPLFNDANIIKAISELRTLFEYKSK